MSLPIDSETLRNELMKMLDSKTQTELASSMGISKSYLSRYFAGERKPGEKFLRGVGFEEVIMYRKLGD